MIDTLAGGADFNPNFVKRITFSRNGTIYIADSTRVYKIAPGTTALVRIAGIATTTSGCYSPGIIGGLAVNATLCGISDVAVDSLGNVYVAERAPNRVRKIDVGTGIISAFVGTWGIGNTGDGGPATSAGLGNPGRLALDAANNLYIATSEDQRVRRVSAQTGIITTVAGSGALGLTGDGGPATEAKLDLITDLAFDAAGNLFIAHPACVRKVDAVTGVITRVAGNGVEGSAGNGGPAISAPITSEGIAFDSSGKLYIAGGGFIRVVDAAGVITSYAGAASGATGENIPAAGALMFPKTILFDATGNLLYHERQLTAGAWRDWVKKISPAGLVSTVSDVRWVQLGDGLRFTPLMGPSAFAHDAQGRLYVADEYLSRVFRLDLAQDRAEIIAGGGSVLGDGGPATTAELTHPSALAMDAAGNLYIGTNYRIRRVTPGGTISTVVGTGSFNVTAEEGLGTTLAIGAVTSVAVVGNDLYFTATFGTDKIQKLSLTTGMVSRLNIDARRVAEADGDLLFWWDRKLSRLRPSSVSPEVIYELPAASPALQVASLTALPGNAAAVTTNDLPQVLQVSSSGITILAGVEPRGFSGDRGPADVAQLTVPVATLALGGKIYIADRGDSRVRVLTPACPYSVNPSAATIPAGGGGGSFTATPTSGCVTWAAGSSVPWLKIQGASNGTSSSAITYAADPNQTAVTRSAFISVNGSHFTATQPASCTVTISPSAIVTPDTSTAATTVTVLTSTPTCRWSVNDLPQWLWVTNNALAPSYITGPATIEFRPNNTNVAASSRVANVAVGDKTLVFTQYGSASMPECSANDVVLTPAALTSPAQGASVNVQLTFRPGVYCRWTAASNKPWLQIYPLSGNTAGPIRFDIHPNYTTASRMAVVTVSGQTAGVVQAATSVTADERFVGQLYFNFFGRVPATAEVAVHVNALRAGGTTRAALLEGFFRSEEFTNAGRFAAGLYVGLLDRDGEYGGWVWQRNNAATGLSPLVLTSNFISSQERALRFPESGAADFVRTLYRYILRREPPQADVDFQVAAMATIGRVQVAYNFLMSEEFKRGTDPRLTSFLLYAILLQRDGTPAERAVVENQINTGIPLKTIMEGLINTAEFQSLLN